MGKNRDGTSIIAAIAEAAGSEGASKTHIIYQANLSFRVLDKYLRIATKAGLVNLHGHLYTLTEKGRDFLGRYQDFHRRYDKLQRSMDALSTERDNLAQLCQNPGLKNSVRCIDEEERMEEKNAPA